MKLRLRSRLAVIPIAILLFILVGPFLVPVRPIPGLVPPEALADPDSHFIEINGVTLHVKFAGDGDTAFVLLHGFGASLYSWDPIFQSLSERGLVIAYDRPAFGLTERPTSWQGINPYSQEAQVEQVIGLLDYFNVEKAVLIGNSAGGTIAMLTALQYPDRVQALVLVDPAVYAGGGAPTWIRPLLKTPQMRHLGPLITRQIGQRGEELLLMAWSNPAAIPQSTFDLYRKPLQVENWDRALWEFTLASKESGLAERLKDLAMPTLVITGSDDRIVPTADTIRLAEELPNAQLTIIDKAGHVPHEEKPGLFMESVVEFLSNLDDLHP